jgi:hypothetical protein
MEYNYLVKDGKTLKIGVYTTYFPNLDPRFIKYQKKVFDKFGIKINQIENQPNLLGRGYNSHGTFLTETSKNEDVDYLIFFDADALPLHPDFLQIVIDRTYGKQVILGIEQRTNHIPNSIPYAGPACFVISKETYNALGQPHYNETDRSDVAEELTHIAREKGIEVDMFKFEKCEIPLWDLSEGRKFGTASSYEGLAFHNFESRNSEKIEFFVNKCKEILGEYDLHIIMHILPQEIDQLEQTLVSLKRSSRYINNRILVEVALNCNLTKFIILPKEFFTNKLSQLEQLTKSWADTNFIVSENEEILGCVDQRRLAFKNSNASSILILDVDMIFSDSLLYHIINSAILIQNHNFYYIITPQLTRLWDESWDELVNEQSLSQPLGEFQNRDPYNTSGCMGEVGLKPVNNFKFGGGWFTLISNSLAKLIPIPDSLGAYGLEDTYVMTCANACKQKGMDIQQYVITNEVVVEDAKYRSNPYKNYVEMIDRREEFKKAAHTNYPKEIEKFVFNLVNQK